MKKLLMLFAALLLGCGCGSEFQQKLFAAESLQEAGSVDALPPPDASPEASLDASPEAPPEASADEASPDAADSEVESGGDVVGTDTDGADAADEPEANECAGQPDLTPCSLECGACLLGVCKHYTFLCKCMDLPGHVGGVLEQRWCSYEACMAIENPCRASNCEGYCFAEWY